MLSTSICVGCRDTEDCQEITVTGSSGKQVAIGTHPRLCLEDIKQRVFETFDIAPDEQYWEPECGTHYEYYSRRKIGGWAGTYTVVRGRAKRKEEVQDETRHDARRE